MAGRPLSSAGKDIAGRMVKLASTIEGASAETVKASAERAKKAQLEQMRRDSGGDLMLSGVNRAKGKPGNAKIGVSYRVRKATGFDVGATAFVKATGPLQIINNDTSGRVIRSAWSTGRGTVGRTRVARKGFVGPVLPGQFSEGGRRAVLKLPDGNFRRAVRHPGTDGKDTWQKGRPAAEREVSKTMRTRTTTVIRKGMRP